MAAHAFPLFRTFARDTRGAAGIELGFGAVALLTIAMLCFDLYSLVRVNTAGARSAVAMAEYVSREAAPDGDQMAALARFLHRQEFGAPADVVYVVSAVRRPPGEDLDLNRTVPAMALLLDVEPSAGLDQLFDVAGRMPPDAQMLDGVRAERSDRISLYAYRLGSSPPPAPPMPALDWLLGQLRHRSQLVLVDGLDDPEAHFSAARGGRCAGSCRRAHVRGSCPRGTHPRSASAAARHRFWCRTIRARSNRRRWRLLFWTRGSRPLRTW